jgi:hypothetical protein
LAQTDITSVATKTARNDLVYRLIFLSDYRFSRYEADLMLGKATRDSFIDLSMFGVNSAATLLTPGSATRVLSAIAAGLGFSRSTIEKNFYMNHAAPVLMAKMRALRKEKLNEIVRNLARGIDDYPATLAIIDVLDYYNRGTMLGALQSISNETAVQEIEAEGGRVIEPPKAPPVVEQIKAGTVSRQFSRSTLFTTKSVAVGSTAPVASAATTEFSARRRALGSLVVVFRKQANVAKAAEILRAGGVAADQSQALGKLGEAVDDISTRADLDKWERAFGITSSGLVKTPAVEIPNPVEPLMPETPRSSSTIVPKTAPPEVKEKIDPL